MLYLSVIAASRKACSRHQKASENIRRYISARKYRTIKKFSQFLVGD
jgi:hypothetical protein